MSGECERCGEHCLECRCINSSLTADIQSKISKIYKKYKDHPNELIYALEFFIEAVDDDRKARLLDEEEQFTSTYCNEVPVFMDNLIFGWWPSFKKKPKKERSDNGYGYLCRVCATQMGAVPPKDHICTWHRGTCRFCEEEANLCHTSDWNWPDKKEWETDREY